MSYRDSSTYAGETALPYHATPVHPFLPNNTKKNHSVFNWLKWPVGAHGRRSRGCRLLYASAPDRVLGRLVYKQHKSSIQAKFRSDGLPNK